MGRRKIEIKAIKDDRNRSVTFLKRKGGLFKKAHELSVLCSVDVAVFIFGSNKKLYEYSSTDMRELVGRYTFHGGPSEHKGPGDFSRGGDDDDDEDLEGTPPHGHEGSVEPQMIPPHFQAQQAFTNLRNSTQSVSPPLPFGPRVHTPQPPMVSRPSSGNDFRRPANVPPPGSAPAPQPVVNGYSYMPHYNQQVQSALQHVAPAPPAQYQYAPVPHAPQIPSYIDESRRSTGTPNFAPPPPPPQAASRPQPSPPQAHIQQLPQSVPHMSPPQPSHQHLEVPVPQRQPHIQLQHIPEPPSQQTASMDPPRSDRLHDRPTQPGLDTSIIRRHPRTSQSGSIFTPIDDNRSILGQHLDSFHADAHVKKEDGVGRGQTSDVGGVSRVKMSKSPPVSQRSNPGPSIANARGSTSAIVDGGFTPPSRSNSMKIDGASRPRLRVQIPDEASDAGSNTGEPATTSPRGAADASAQPARRNGADAPRLPPPSPSTTALLSAGATGPPNPFARPPPQTHSTAMNMDTPVSALPSRFLSNDFLPSPSSFYPEWNFRGDNSNTLPSPLNFATPVAGSGPSFLRDDSGPSVPKRKSPEISAGGSHSDNHEGFEPKRIKVDG